ncbi:alpha/beta fold hydrolase [Amycolatopsis sp. CA-230715]|uniref:alpha/beta fold hydrolase n=1 Tax=Amycolatopsis sp. CA-230715 TaxID=2745196 RepID=UPI001C022CFA|nr:alpha/beta hydrolase [Amycolatopsis sp. CA-230715]
MTVDIAPPARLGETALPDGRLLGWAEWGPRDGVPVLLSPGAATSRWLGCGAVEGLGVRLISLDRPGLGVSTPSPGRTFADFAADIRAFAAERDLGKPAMVGNSQGGPFALACAEEGVISALALVSCADEVAAPEFADRIPAGLRDIVTKAREDPAGAEAMFAGFDAGTMWDMVIAGSPDVDLAVYRDPSFEATYRRALAEAFQQGAAGYARDTLLAMSRWPFRFDAITAPVDIWYGERDVSHSPDNGEWLTSRIGGAHRHLVPDAGGSLLWTHAEAILRRLLAHIERH